MGRLVSNDGPIYTQLYSFLAHLHTAVFILGPIQLLHSCSWWGCPQFNNPISQIQNKSDLKNLFMERERERVKAPTAKWVTLQWKMSSVTLERIRNNRF